MRDRRFASFLLVLVISATLALALLMGALRGGRIDLTQGHIYTLTPATVQLLAGMKTNISLKLYFSEQLSAGMPDVRNYAQHVRDTLEEMVAQANGHLRLQVLDPAPFSEAEDAATAAGLQAVPANASGDSIYLGLAARTSPGKNAAGKEATISFFQPDREQFLEYELAKLIAALERNQAPIVGLVSSLPVDPHFDVAAGRAVGGWIALAQLQQSFVMRQPHLDDATSLRELDVLVLIHPQRLSAPALFNLDQFVLRGGKLLVFVDPNADSQANPNPQPGLPPLDQSSDLGPLLAAWGVAYDKRQVVADAHYALTVSLSDRAMPVRHVGMLGIDSEGFDHGDVVSAQLKQMNFASTGALAPLSNAKTTFTALVSSSFTAALLDAERFRVVLDPNTLAQGLLPAGKRYALAARITGPARTAFPNGSPTAALGTNKTASSPTLQRGNISVVVVADTDLLTDLLWVQVQPFFGQPVATPFASNGDFLLNTVDHLTGSTALISLRGRAPFQRPFVRVEALLRRADERTKQEERRLEAQLQETETRLAALQRDGTTPGASAAALPQAQRKELMRFSQRKLSIRKALRQVNRDLSMDIERLGTLLKLINIFAMPALLTVFGVGWALRRRSPIRVS